jgi:putative ABC transport system permease protein
VLAFGVLPALRVTAGHTHADLAAATRVGSVGRAGHRLNRALVGAELALAMVLTTASGLMLHSFAALRAVDPGLDASDVLLMRVAPPPARYEGARLAGFYDEIRERVRALPGVTGVGAIQLAPFHGGNWMFPYLAEGHAPPADGPLELANIRIVTPGYFDAVDMPIGEGRTLGADDREGAERVMVINGALARELWPGESAIGRTIRVLGNVPYRIVGIVGDIRQHTLDSAPSAEMYVTQSHFGGPSSMTLAVEGTAVSALGTAIAETIRAIDADVPVTRIETMSAALGDSLARRRFFASVLTAFGVLALLLGGLGVYGVMSHLIGARIRDFGLRMALGAGPGRVLREAVRDGVAPVLFGLVAGTAGAVASAGLLRGLLFDVAPVNLPTYAAVAGVLLGVAGLATWLPARRAARTDPLTVLRTD